MPNMLAPSSAVNQPSAVVIAIVSENVKPASPALPITDASGPPPPTPPSTQPLVPETPDDVDAIIATSRQRQASKRRNIESKRERKAAKTLVCDSLQFCWIQNI